MGAGVTPPLAAVGRLPTVLTLQLALKQHLYIATVQNKKNHPPYTAPNLPK